MRKGQDWFESPVSQRRRLLARLHDGSFRVERHHRELPPLFGAQASSMGICDPARIYGERPVEQLER